MKSVPAKTPPNQELNKPAPITPKPQAAMTMAEQLQAAQLKPAPAKPMTMAE